MRTVKFIGIATIIVLGIAAVLSDNTVLAQAGDVKRGINSVSTGSPLSFDNALEAIVNTLLFIIGAVSVIMIIYGGFRYVTSGGEASAVKSAKDTIMYAAIGLVVALLAWSIANFVIDALTPNAAEEAGRGAGEAVRDSARDSADAARNSNTPPPSGTIGPTP